MDDSSNKPDVLHPLHRPVRSFVVRAGRMGSGQARALATLGPKFMVPFQKSLNPGMGSPADTSHWFGRAAPLIIEIGFGMGQATANFAQTNPTLNVLGIEVHPPGVGALLQLLEQQAIPNVRIIQHDAVEVLQESVAPDSVAGIHCFFPDPWHKKRHHKRRLIQPAWVALLASRLKPGGYIHLATDWKPYAQQMLQVLNDQPLLISQSPGGYVARPASRPITKFEQRGLNLGHGVWDLLYVKVGA